MSMNRIYDLINRHQLYIEGVKKWYGTDFKRYLKRLAEELKKLFGQFRVETLGELTKRQVNAFFKKLDAISNSILGQYGTEFLREVRRFVGVDTVLQRGAFGIVREGLDFTSGTVSKVWAKVAGDIVPAFGQNPKDATQEFVGRAKHEIKTTAATAIQDGLKPVAAITELLGDETAAEYKGGALGRIWSRAKGYVNTLLQHASVQVSDTFNAIVSDCYIWMSVIDGVTSDVCRARNNVVFEQGGPRPPAHPHCRSRTAPAECGTDPNFRVPGFRAWVREQDREMLADVAGGGFDLAKLLQLGDGAAKAIIEQIKPLTVDELATKTAMLTKG